MTTLNYSITIACLPATVWQNLWNDASYRQWTAVFMEGSYAESSWQQGDKISFLTPNGNGMFGVIQTRIENKEMTFRHLGEIKNGVEKNKGWEHATESYRLSEAQDGTLLKVVLTMDDDNAKFESYFNDTFPKALAILKQLCEG